MPDYTPKTLLGEHEGRIVHINQVRRFSRKHFICPKCGESIIPKKGLIVAPHFAHKPNIECSIAAETALHKYAKQVIADRGKLWLPGYEGVLNPTLFEFDSIDIEQKLGDIIPDIILHKGDELLLVEIAVT